MVLRAEGTGGDDVVVPGGGFQRLVFSVQGARYGVLSVEGSPMAQGRSTKIISTMKWIRTSRLSIQNSLAVEGWGYRG